MKKGYYVHFDVKGIPGVAKKIDMQIAELSKFYDMTEINIRSAEVSLATRLLRLLPGGAIARTYQEALEEIHDPTFVYVRRATADKYYVSFFKELKARWPECKVIVEIFTYPYDKDDFAKWNAWPFYFKERYNRKRLPQYVDRYVTYSQDERIFGIPTIRTSNGILVDGVKLPKAREQADDTINLIAVAFMQKHHGYERLIKGMHKYYQDAPAKEVILHLVGDGPEKQKYQDLTKRYGLEDKVLFYPTVIGDSLDDVYELGDVAISSLGWYKDGLKRENTLKAKEYMAKGFPMVTGCPVDHIPNGYPYICEFSNDATPIDILRIVQFYENLLQQHLRQEMQDEIRSFVKRIADMPIVMKPIVDYVEKG